MAKAKDIGNVLPHRRLAEGEMTGHYHEATGDGVLLLELPDGVILLDAPTGSTVTHQEHGPLAVPAGEYERVIVQEYDHFAEEARDVRD